MRHIALAALLLTFAVVAHAAPSEVRLSAQPGLAETIAQASARQEPPAPSEWAWRLDPCLGAGTTLANGFNATVSVGAVLGTFPPRIPIIGGHDFGGVYCQVNGEPGGGPFVNLFGPVDLAFLVWRGQRVEGDVALMARKAWEF
jgi:hypothetical protein